MKTTTNNDITKISISSNELTDTNLVELDNDKVVNYFTNGLGGLTIVLDSGKTIIVY